MHELGNITPTLEEFRQYAATRRVIPVRTTVLADSLTPVGPVSYTHLTLPTILLV